MYVINSIALGLFKVSNILALNFGYLYFPETLSFLSSFSVILDSFYRMFVLLLFEIFHICLFPHYLSVTIYCFLFFLTLGSLEVNLFH